MRLVAGAVPALLALAACGQGEQQQEQQQQQGRPQAAPAQNGAAPAPAQQAGVTPMAERVAVLGLLNKRNGIVRNLTMKPGQALRVRTRSFA